MAALALGGNEIKKYMTGKNLLGQPAETSGIFKWIASLFEVRSRERVMEALTTTLASA